VATALRQGKTSVGQPMMGRVVQAPVFGMAAPIRNAQGQVIGALTGITMLGQPNFLDAVVNNRYGKSGGFVLLMPSARLIITATDKSRIMTALPAPGSNPTLDRFVAGFEGSAVYVNPMGTEVLGSAKSIPAAGWSLGLTLPTAEAFAPVRTAQQRMLWGTLLFTLIGGAVISWLIRWMLRREFAPMLTATRALGNLSAGDQPLQALPIDRPDELGELIHGFNRLLASLAQRQEALRASEAGYRGIFENANTGIGLTDAQGQIISFNEAFRAMLGYERQALLRMNFADLTDPDDLKMERVFFDEILSGQRNQYRITKRYIASDGHRVWIDISVAAIRDAQGQVTHFIGVVHDITERRQLEALQVSEAFKQAILNAVAAEIAVLDHDGVIVAVNEAWRQFGQVNGVEPGKPATGTAVGDNYLVACRQAAARVTDDALQAWAGIRAVLGGRQTSFSMEYPCHSPGQERWFSMNVTPLGEGAQHGAVIAHTDISTRKLHERLAMERAEQTQFILDNVIDGILTVDRQGAVQSMNRAAQAIFGLQAAQVLGHNVSTLMPEPYRSQLDSYLREVPDADVARITGGVREVEGLRGDGSVFPMDLAVSRGVQRGQPIFIGVVRDVTQRKRAEQALLDSQKRLEAAQLLARMGDWEVDLQSGEMHWSKEVFVITGQDPTHFRPSLAAMRAALHPADAHLLRRAMRQAERTGSFDVVHRMQRPDGSLRYVHTLASARRADGRVRRLTGAVQDVTEAHQAELTLRQARDTAEKASQAKTEFLSAMSHELRTPMNAMLGFAQLIEYDPGLPDEHKDNAREILKAGYHLLQLINEVLDLSRIESGQLALSLEAVQAGLVVRECLQLVRPMAAHHGIKIGEFDSGEATVRADRTRLRQVLLNLLSNAVKYNRRGGSVRVELRAHGTDRLRILVSDTGVGIAPERQSELFLPFSRLGIEGGNIEGSGIGLNITRRLAEMMGGSVDVESVPGKGSTFWIELTCDTVPEYSEPQAVSETAISTQRCEGPRHRVLYIEDNPANLKLVAQILARRKDIDLLTADNPQAGLALASTHAPSLILLDINLPGLDGYQVLARLKADQRLCAIPVVAVTAKAMPRDIERGMAAGFSDYLTKPLDLARFREVVERVLGLGVQP